MFEELLRANDIDYYMGQSFREQLAQSTALAQRVVTKISGRKKTLLISFIAQNTKKSLCFTVAFIYTGDGSETHDDKMAHNLLALR